MQFTAEQIQGGYNPHQDQPLTAEGLPKSPTLEVFEGIKVNTADNSLGAIRSYRDGLLSNCDWTQAVDSPLSGEKKADWATYRQELRDITSIEDLIGVHDPRWPVAPV
jgi:hypothetical protein